MVKILLPKNSTKVINTQSNVPNMPSIDPLDVTLLGQLRHEGSIEAIVN